MSDANLYRPFSIIPREIIAHIIRLGAASLPAAIPELYNPGPFAPEVHPGTSSDFLKSCSLVCKEWTGFAQECMVRHPCLATGKKAVAFLERVQARGAEDLVKTIWMTGTSVAEIPLGNVLEACRMVRSVCWVSRKMRVTPMWELAFLASAQSALLTFFCLGITPNLSDRTSPQISLR